MGAVTLLARAPQMLRQMMGHRHASVAGLAMRAAAGVLMGRGANTIFGSSHIGPVASKSVEPNRQRSRDKLASWGTKPLMRERVGRVGAPLANWADTKPTLHPIMDTGSPVAGKVRAASDPVTQRPLTLPTQHSITAVRTGLSGVYHVYPTAEAAFVHSPRGRGLLIAEDTHVRLRVIAPDMRRTTATRGAFRSTRNARSCVVGGPVVFPGISLLATRSYRKG